MAEESSRVKPVLGGTDGQWPQAEVLLLVCGHSKDCAHTNVQAQVAREPWLLCGLVDCRLRYVQDVL